MVGVLPAQAATSAPASRRRVDTARATAVRAAKPGPPSATTTTPASPGPPLAISPDVEQPIRGMSPVRPLMPRSSAGRSCAAEAKTRMSRPSAASTASPAAWAPAASDPGSAEVPTPNQRVGGAAWPGGASLAAELNLHGERSPDAAWTYTA